MSVPVAELKTRRAALRRKLADDSVVMVFAGDEVTRSNDTEYPFRPHSDFFYLTGLDEPGAVLVMVQGDETPDLLFVQPRDAEAEIWHGRRYGEQTAQALSGVDACHSLDALGTTLVQTLGTHAQLYWHFSVSEAVSAQQQQFLQAVRSSSDRKLHAPSTLKDIAPVMAELRLIKSTAEQTLMRQSAAIACAAHRRAMRFVQPGRYEYQVAAELHHQFAMQGAAAPAYSTICGSGENACILHYTSNQSELKDGDLLLIDAGCEYRGYASDISRTFPVNGRFTAAQTRLYNWVLKAQRAAIDVIRPGATIAQAYAVAAEILTEGLMDIGVLSGTLEDNLKSMAYRPYFMHGLGHWIGLDVHDVGSYQTSGKARALKAGMVLTIEPGLYIPRDTDCAPEYQGVGVRIEDDILVTKDGHENLTASVPVTIEEIEALMQSQEALYA
ncbi:Xaa-Pro aminopeptidase [Aliidiomarina sp. Khilg15.8]